MSACPSCGAEKGPADAACGSCGALPAATADAPELELPVPERRAARSAPRKASKAREEEAAPLELAVDPHTFAPVPDRPPPRAPVLAPSAPPPRPSARPAHDVTFDAHLLAEYGDPPRHWVLTPFYAWRVLRRQRALKATLAERRGEAARALDELEDALVAFAERIRPAAEKLTAYGSSLDDLRRSEELLRSRDRVLAAEQDAQTARLASVDARLGRLETEVAKAQEEERAAAAELASAQSALAREEAKLKRAESELKAAQQREATGGAQG